MASNARNVARALPPLNPGAMSPGGFGGVQSTFGSQNLGGTSPVVSSYQQWTQGRPYGNPLPREWQTFLSGSFGPLAPIEPVGIDTPDPISGRPEPRRFTYPVAWNMPVGTPGDEGLKLVPFATLRAMADTYSVARACINVRKQEVLGLAWNIAPTREAEKKMGGGVSSARKDFEKRRAEAIAFFENPDPGKYRSFTTWLSAVLEDILVIDALSVYLQPTRLPGKGLLGSNLQSLRLIDGSTVRPLLDVMGGTPQPPNVAYQIFNFGIPRVDMTTAIAGADIKDIDPNALEAEYRGDQLLYLPYEQRNWTPYGFACIEKALVPILSGLQKQKYQLDYFSEGSIPGIFISSGDSTATPNQLRTLQDALNAMAGDPAWKHKIIVLPGGSRIEPMRPVPLADQFDEVVMTQVCMAFDIMPMELGIAPKVSTTMSPGASNQMAKASQSIHERKSLKPLLLWLKENVFDFVLQKVCGQEDMQFTWEGLEEGEDRESLIDNLINQVEHGLMSIDEARVELGEQPWGLPLTSDPVWATATGIVPVGAIDPSTGRPMGEQLALPTQAGVATQGPAPAPTKPGSPAKPATTPAKPTAKPAATPAKTPSTTRPVTGTPAHATSGASTKPAQSTGRAVVTPKKTTSKVAALREIDLYRRRMIRGRDTDDWVFEFVPDDVVQVLKAEHVEPIAAINRARAMIKSADRLAARDAVVNEEAASLARTLGSLAQSVRQGTIGHMEFIDKGTALMRSGIRSGLFAGARLALSPAHPVTKDDGEDYDIESILDGPYGEYLASLADQLGGEQSDFLQGLLQDLLTAGLLIDAFLSRFGLYGAQVRSAFEQGFGMSVFAADPDAYIIWHTTSARPCDLCAPRDGQVYSAATLPGWPGDGGFGGMSASGMGLCMGGPNCKCYLEAVQGDQSSIGINPMSGGGLADLFGDDLNRASQIAQDIRAAREAFLASTPNDAVPAEDEMPTGVSGVAERLHGDVASMGGHVAPEHGGMAEARRAVLGKKKKKGKKKGKKADPAPELPPALSEEGSATEVTHEDHGDHHLPDETEHVYAYLARHYPLDVIEWVKGAVWRGPVSVDLSEIQFERRPGGARDEEKVSMMVHSIKDGTPPDSPVVLVQTPSSPPYKVADGYHRLAAFHDAGVKSIKAWIGKVSTETGPWGKIMNEAKLNH